MNTKFKKLMAILLCLTFLICASSCSLVLVGLRDYLNELPIGENETDSGTQPTGEIDETKNTEDDTVKNPLTASPVNAMSALENLIGAESGSSSPREGIADIVDKIAGAVVAINVYGTATDYFNRSYPTEGAGSGVIISADGYIITNNHVITGGNSITVFINDGTSYEAEVIGADEKADLALLKIDAKGLTNAKIGNSSTLRVGDTAIAIGNPLGELQGTVSKGIISALDREINIDGNTLVLLQTDAAVNPGNSGGGLFDSNGDLIGIVTAKEASAEVEGLGFAIPMDTAKPIVSDLLQYGYVKGRPTLGIETLLISSKYSAYASGVDYIGVYVYSVESGTTAEAAGLKRADYINTVDGELISTEERFWEIIESKDIGDKITLEIYRQKTKMTIEVEIEEAH